MKKKNGFTLIELIAVIVIIGVLVGISIPAVTNNIVKSQKKAYKNLEDNMKAAARDYYTVHTDLVVPGTSGHRVSGAELHDMGYLDNMIDAIDKTVCDYENSYVVTTATQASDYNLKYSYKICLRCENYVSDSCE